MRSAEGLILDYKQFLAARNIQRFVRGWLVRSHMANIDRSAIVIQRWWRGFMCRRMYTSLVEERLQEAAMAYYNQCALRIQTLFRGWWSRKHVFDLTKLKIMQRLLAEDLIHAMVKLLHTDKGSNMLPGVYTLRNNEKCLKFSEQLLVTFGYRFYNAQACYKTLLNSSLISEQRQAFLNAERYTYVPYMGFNYGGVCNRRTSFTKSLKAKDGELFDIIQTFMSGHRAMDLGHTGKRDQMINLMLEEARMDFIQKRKRFLKHIVASMQKWSGDGEKILPKSLFKKPYNMVALLEAVKDNIVERYGPLDPCICGPSLSISSI
ncbi:hypothetical protein KR074_005973, partial [Drosophila pseudoananassae]